MEYLVWLTIAFLVALVYVVTRTRWSIGKQYIYLMYILGAYSIGSLLFILLGVLGE